MYEKNPSDFILCWNLCFLTKSQLKFSVTYDIALYKSVTYLAHLILCYMWSLNFINCRHIIPSSIFLVYIFYQ